jgi:thiamine biosynthesis lipoprotein
MGTWVAIEARAQSPESGLQALEEAFAAIRNVEQQMHPRREGSDLRRISEGPLHEPLEIQRGTWEVLELAKRVSELTEGIFDPCLPCQAGTLANVELAIGSSVICHAPVALDLGGIAKGYAVDRAVEALIGQGCVAGLVNAGGDLRVFGPVRHSLVVRREDGSGRLVEIENAALAVSDRDACRRPGEHQGYYVRQGEGILRQPHAGRRYAAVLAPDAACADALTKCVLLCPEALISKALRSLGGRMVL